MRESDQPGAMPSCLLAMPPCQPGNGIAWQMHMDGERTLLQMLGDGAEVYAKCEHRPKTPQSAETHPLGLVGGKAQALARRDQRPETLTRIERTHSGW